MNGEHISEDVETQEPVSIPQKENVPKISEKKKKGYDKLGSAGLPGVSFQIDLIVVFLLNGIGKHTANWRLSTENKAGDKFDDIVFESSTGDVLLQAKHKQNESKKISFSDLLATNSKKCDFSLPMYFFSYQEVKKSFKAKQVILCTNTGIQIDKEIEKVIERHDLDPQSLLDLPGHDRLSYYTFNEDLIPKLKENIEVYFKENLQRRNISPEIISDEEIADYLRHLQVISNYPCSDKLQKAIKTLITRLECSQNLNSEVCMKYIRHKVEEWYKEKGIGKYYTKTIGEALFSDIRSSLYCETLKQHKIYFERNDSLAVSVDAKRIRHIIPRGNNLLTEIKVFQEVKRRNLTVLFLDTSLCDNIKRRIVDSFEVDKYTHLIIISCQRWTGDVVLETRDKILDILDRYKYKQVLVIGHEENPLIEEIKFANQEMCEERVDETFFSCLEEDTRTEIKERRCILFQGKEVSLNELGVPDESLEDIISSEIIVRLAINERIVIGHQLSREAIDHCYITRRVKHMKSLFLEEDLYSRDQWDEKAIVLSGIAGMGKSVLLTKLSVSIKANFPHLWVIRVDLNAFKKYLWECHSNLNPANLLDMINSLEETKLNSVFELNFFTLHERVVLLLDGFDEISPKYTDIVCSILEDVRDRSNFKTIFVTTRPHLCEILENVFKVESYTFQPFSNDDQKEFLAKYWTKSLNPRDSSASRKCLLYAEELIKKMGIWIDDGQNTFGTVPLQIKMLAEVFQEKIHSRGHMVDLETCKEFLTSDNTVPKLPETINLAELYGKFITKKCDVLIHEKEKIGGNDLAEEGLRKLVDDYRELHCTLALDVLLDKNQCEIFLCYNHLAKEDEKLIGNLLKVGLIQRMGSDYQFIHRTFAEYFTARAILMELKRESQDKRFQKYLVEDLLKLEDFYTVRAFLNDFLDDELPTIPRNTFETYHFVRISKSRTWRGYEEDTFLHVISGEGCNAILRFFLQCLNFTGFSNIFYYILSKLLPKSVHINMKGDWGDTPLHRAANNGHIRVVKLLIEDPRIDVSIIDGEGLTPLDQAAENGHLLVVKYLSEVGKVAIFNKTIHRTAKKGHFDVVAYLMEKVDVKYLPGCQVLHFSAYHGRCDIVTRLLEVGVDVNAKDVSGYTAFNYACTAHSEDAMKLLVDKGASPCSHGTTESCKVKLFFALPRNIPRSEVRFKEPSKEATVQRKFFKNYVEQQGL